MMCVCCDTSGYVAAAAKNNAVYLSTHAIIMWLHTRPRIYRCGAPARFGTGGTTKLSHATEDRQVDQPVTLRVDTALQTSYAHHRACTRHALVATQRARGPIDATQLMPLRLKVVLLTDLHCSDFMVNP